MVRVLRIEYPGAYYTRHNLCEILELTLTLHKSSAQKRYARSISGREVFRVSTFLLEERPVHLIELAGFVRRWLDVQY